MPSVSLATWNVNSIRAREERLLNLLNRNGEDGRPDAPDILCLQETKVEDAGFPVDAIAEAGYHVVFHGQRTYNGVAILSREPATDVVSGLPGDSEDTEARLIAATIAGLRVIDIYVPNGRSVTDEEKYPYKLRWLERLERFVATEIEKGQPLVLCGDYNIAPEDHDVAFPERWASSVLCHEKVRDAYGRLIALGLHDVLRHHAEPPGPYTWWDYRRLAFPKGDGIRIDHILTTQDALAMTTGSVVDRTERKGKQPSDHAPVFAYFEVPA